MSSTSTQAARRGLSLALRVTALAIGAVAVILAVAAFYVDASQRKVAVERIEARVASDGRAAVSDIENWFGGRTRLIASVADRIATAADETTANDALIGETLQDVFALVFYGDEQGQFLRSDHKQMPADFDPRKRGWYVDAKARGGAFLTRPYTDALSGDLVISAIHPVRSGGKLQGNAGVDFTLGALSDMISKIDFGGVGQAVIVAEDGTILVAGDAARSGASIEDDFPGASGVATGGISRFESKDGTHILAHAVALDGLEVDGWRLLLLLDEDAASADLTQARRAVDLALLLTVIIVAVVLALLMRRLVAAPLNRMTEAMRALAGGDLTIDVPYQTRTDEIGRMSAALGVFRENAQRVAALEKENAEREAREAAERQRLSSEFVSVVDAAADGDFSRRVPTDFSTEETRALAEATNGMMGAVDSGIAAISRALAALADADLSYRISEPLKGAFARLRDDAHAGAEGLAALVGRIHGSTQVVSQRSGDISSGAADLSSQSASQASSIEETAAAMEEISSTIASNADALSAAEKQAGEAAARSRRGGELAADARISMERIAQSSDKIKEIISLIDGIAFQTNLLALNASVEAARAGEAGKGFAVVASEVRALAQRSADAARSISELITESAEHVSGGVAGVAGVAEALEQISATVEPLMRAIAEVSGAGREQATGVSEVSGAVSQIDQMVQRNAAVAEAFTTAAEELRQEIAELSKAALEFRIDSAHRRQTQAA